MLQAKALMPYSTENHHYRSRVLTIEALPIPQIPLLLLALKFPNPSSHGPILYYPQTQTPSIPRGEKLQLSESSALKQTLEKPMNFQGSRARLLLVFKEAWPREVRGGDWPAVPAAQDPRGDGGACAVHGAGRRPSQDR